MILSRLKYIDISYKSGIIFGLFALICSFIVGLIAGNDISRVFLNTFLMTIVFIALGYGVIFIIKKFVPEMFEVLNQQETSMKHEDDSMISSGNSGDDEAGEHTESSDEITTDNSLGSGDGDLGQDMSANIDNKKLGKHIIINEKKIKYEPKIMAEAIKTMLKRDSD